MFVCVLDYLAREKNCFSHCVNRTVQKILIVNGNLGFSTPLAS